MISGLQARTAHQAYATHRSEAARPEAHTSGRGFSFEEQLNEAQAGGSQVHAGIGPTSRAATSQINVKTSGFSAFAAKYDVHAMTPREIDAFIETVPLEGEDAGNLMMLKAYGAEFQRHITESLREAGIAKTTDEELEAQLGRPIDLIDHVETNIAYNKSTGGPTEAAEKLLEWLGQFER